VAAGRRRGREFEGRFRLAGPDGEVCWVHGRVAPVRDGDGVAVAMVGAIEDVSERFVAELQAHSLAAEREATLGQMTDGVIVTDREGTIRFVNAAAVRLHARACWACRSSSTRAATGCARWTGARARASSRRWRARCCAARAVRDARWRIVRPDGAEDDRAGRRSARGRRRRRAAGRGAGDARRDARARHRAGPGGQRGALPRDGRQHPRTWRGWPIRPGAVYWYNRRWFDYTGTTLEEARGDGWTRAHHPEHVARVLANYRRAFAAGRVWEDTFPLRRHDGQWRWFLSRAEPIRDEAGRIERWFGTSTDVTEQREADRRKDEFLAMLAHELRNPLAPVLNAARWLQRSAALDAPAPACST
jgi:PAS domain S-box-containing protein